MTRISRHQLYMAFALQVAKRSTCLRGNVGAVIVLEDRPISIGYNGSPPDQPHCTEVGCLPLNAEQLVTTGRTTLRPGDKEAVLAAYGCQRTIHAELNAVAWAARRGLSTRGATMYCSHAPCKPCAQAVAAAGLSRLVYAKPYRAARLDILEDSGIEVIHFAAADVLCCD